MCGRFYKMEMEMEMARVLRCDSLCLRFVDGIHGRKAKSEKKMSDPGSNMLIVLWQWSEK